MTKPPLFMARNIIQNAWVVKDLESAMRSRMDGWGLGPFYVFPHIQLTDYRYHGRPANLDMSVAIAQAGPVQIELVQQHCANPSAYSDTIARGQTGFHHVAIFAKDYDRELEEYRRQGFPIACEGMTGSMRFAYVNTSSRFDCMVELLEDDADIKGAFKIIADAAIDWDGRDPIRQF